MPPPAILPTLLLTGSTGFVGGALTASLLASEDWDRIALLVRAEDRAHGYQRVLRSLARFDPNLERLGRLRPDQVIVGDFTLPDPFIGDPRLRGIRRVMHVAALRTADRNTLVFPVNIDGTLRFAHQLRGAAAIERFVHVSSALICGNDAGRLVREDDYPRSRVKHLSFCTESQAETERLLRATLGDFPLVVARPSTVVGPLTSGGRARGGDFWLFRMMHALRMVTAETDALIDVVPVDYVASALRTLLFKPCLGASTYHVAAGEGASSNWGEIAEAFTAVHAPRRRPVAAGTREAGWKPDVPRYRCVSFSEIEARQDEFEALLGPCDAGQVLAAARAFCGLAQQDTVFDTTRLQAEGLRPPPRFADYLGRGELAAGDEGIAEQGGFGAALDNP